MRLNVPVLTVEGVVTQLRELTNGTGETWAHEITVLSEPRGGRVFVTARVSDGFDAKALPKVNEDVRCLVTVTARAYSVQGETRAAVNVTLGEILETVPMVA